jgi:hypothetical protein
MCLCATDGFNCCQGRQCPVREAAVGARLAAEADQQLNADLLLSSGAVEGPYRRPRPVTRWACTASSLARVIGRFLARVKSVLTPAAP